jgi:hypothetical protein
MGVIHGLELFDPGKFNRLAKAFNGNPAGIAAEAQHGGNAPLDNVPDREGLSADALNSLFVELARERSWELDKALAVGLAAVFRNLPAFAPLKRKFLQFADGDVALPKAVESTYGGLYVVWSSAALQDCLPAIALLQNREDVNSVMREARFSLLHRLTGGPKRARIALENLAKNDYLWENWQNIREAVTAAANGKYLGLCMYL